MKKEEKQKKDELQEKLEAAQHYQDDKKYRELEAKIVQLEQEKKELEEIAKRSQYEYLNLKLDFDRYQKQIHDAQASKDVESLLHVVKKFLPFLEDLRKSLENITDDHKDDPLTQWVRMIYEKFLKTLEHLHISPIEAIGLLPDSFLHEPVSVQPVDDPELKGKIIKEFERWFIYHHNAVKQVITVSKVIVGG